MCVQLLIVDDRIAIVGSADVTDRSMNGDRDSEVNSLCAATFFLFFSFLCLRLGRSFCGRLSVRK